MSLWWMDEGWRETRCERCGSRIWPEGDPDWGLCYDCFSEGERELESPSPKCIVCGKYDAVTDPGVCSESCLHAYNAEKCIVCGKHDAVAAPGVCSEECLHAYNADEEKAR